MAEKKRYFGTAAEILKADDLVVEELEVPEWDMWVRVSSLGGTDRSNYVNSMVKIEHTHGKKGGNTKMTPDLRDAEVRLVSLSLVDESGKRLFSDNQVKDLGRKSAAALGRVGEVAQRLSALGTEDEEEIEGN